MKTNKEKEIFFNEISERLQFYIMDYFQIEELEDVNSYNDLHAMLLYENAFDIEIDSDSATSPVNSIVAVANSASLDNKLYFCLSFFTANEALYFLLSDKTFEYP